MRMYRTLIGYAFAALAFLGYSGFGYAADPYHVASTLRHAVADAGHYGAESAKFKAEQAYAVSMDSVKAVALGGLIGDGNGYLQARADATIGQGVGNQVELS